MKKLLFYSTFAIFSLLCVPFFVQAEEEAKNNLPQAPQTGTPDEDFHSGGTRDNNLLVTKSCEENSKDIIYLLGNENREFTISAHPTFWFYFLKTSEKINNIEFVIEDLNNSKKLYSSTIEIPQKSGLIDITIPATAEYALIPNQNYSWSLNLNCEGEENNTIVTFQGWVHRLPLDNTIQRQLSTISDDQKHQIYWQNDLLYDAVNDLAQRYINEPNNSKLEKAWNKLLTELGWHDLIEPSKVESNVSQNNANYLENP